MIHICNYELGIYIDDYLVKHNYRKNDIFNNKRFNYFTSDELDTIHELTLTGISSLNDLDKLKNLKKLCIKNDKDIRLPLNIDFKNSSDINHITDFTIVEKLTSLESLAIYNDFYIEKLDLGKLTSLKRLVLIDNKLLKNLYNIENLKNLDVIIIVGNKIKQFDNWKNYIINTKESKVNFLDTILMPNLFKNTSNFKLYNSTSNIIFSESKGILDFTTINKLNAKQMYSEALRLYSRLNKSSKFNYIKDLYYYIIDNIEYDEENLLKRSAIYNKLLYTKGAIENKYGKYLTLMNSSVDALIKKKCVCEGYVQLMRFMLSFANIEADIVYCSDYSSEEYDRAALKIKYNNKWFYCDPEWEQRKKIDYFFKTKEEFIKTHKLNSRENLTYKKTKVGSK